MFTIFRFFLFFDYNYFFFISGRLATKIARKDSLAQKLALRPNRQDLIDRNIIPQQSDNERKEFREQIGQKLTR